MEVKARKIDNSRVFTIPQEIDPGNGEYEVFKGRHGVIIYMPKHKSIFEDEEFLKNHNLNQKEINVDKLMENENF
ncbi:hypothetical protein CPR19088_GLDEOEPO_02574 [Companilactobacillus paralimentarius]